MLLELVYNNSAQSYNFQASFVKGGTHLLSEDYAKWNDEKKPERPSPPAIPAAGHFALLSVSAQGTAQGGCVKGQTPAQPHLVMMTQPSRAGQKEILSLFFRSRLVQRVREKIIIVEVKCAWPGSSPTYCLPQQGLLEEALHMCKVLGKSWSLSSSLLHLQGVPEGSRLPSPLTE